MRRRLTRTLLVVLAVAALATAGIVANLVLLGYADARNDPVGKLRPRVDITGPASPEPSRSDDHEHTHTDRDEPDD